MSYVFISEKKCTKCGKCVDICANNAISIRNNGAVIDFKNCNLCKLCIKACELGAISIKDYKINNEKLKNYKDVWVFIECKNSKINKSCLQILSKGRKIADKLGEKLVALIIIKEFPNRNQIIKELSKYGVNEVRLIKYKDLSPFLEENISAIISKEIALSNPNIVLFLGTYLGRVIAPRISANIKTGLTADCTDLKIDKENNLVQVRPTFGGKILANIICPNHRPQMASVRANIFDCEIIKVKKDIKVIEKVVDYNSMKGIKEIVKIIENKSKEKNIEDTSFVICAGKGIGKKEGINLLKKLACKLGAELGCTRAVVDEGWLDSSKQIGQTGKIIRPNIYIGFGVSGAIQHLMGMKRSKTIIAINKDKRAPIFNISDIGIISDLYDVIPELIKNL